ncbi:MAG: hypothetical protein HY902_15870 [Deltaproteobacteria bacterium]|nr:hypothetical protein [Deltaproteobacteria bacterium]
MTDGQLGTILLWTLLATPVLARLAGWATARAMRVAPGRAALQMPGLPARADAAGEPATKFERRVLHCEALVLRALASSPGPYEESALAAQLAQDPEVVGEVLARLRQRVPCRLQVTRAGQLLHHFQASDVAALRRARTLGWPRRIVWWLFALLANLGATWLVFVGIFAGLETLREVWKAAEDDRLITAAEGLGAMLLVIALGAGAGYVVQALVAPWRSGPKLARPLRAEPKDDEPDDIDEAAPASAEGELAPQDEAPGKVARSEKSGKKSGSSWFDGLSFDADVGEGCGGILLILVIAAILALVAGGLWLVVVWARALWRAVARLGEPERDIAPARWVAVARKSPMIEKFVPTNDLAMRILRALRRTVAGVYADEALPTRILQLAQGRGGRVAVVDLMLSEGLSADAALSAGAHLTGRLGGDLLVSEAGDIDFHFPEAALRGQAPRRQFRPGYEYLQLSGGKKLHDLPVNLPGLTLDHVVGAARLAGGPLATVAGLYVATQVADKATRLSAMETNLALVFCVLAPATMILAAATRYAVAESARAGLLRDARRTAMAAVQQALTGKAEWIDAARVAAETYARMAPADPGLTLADVQREVNIAMEDLGMPLHTDPHAAETGRLPLKLAPLRARLQSLQALRDAEPAHAGEADQVVFDTAS